MIYNDIPQYLKQYKKKMQATKKENLVTNQQYKNNMQYLTE